MKYKVKDIQNFYEFTERKGLLFNPEWDNPKLKCLVFPWLRLQLNNPSAYYKLYSISQEFIKEFGKDLENLNSEKLTDRYPVKVSVPSLSKNLSEFT